MMKHGDFTGSAGDYARFRPGYAPQVATAILSYVGRDAASVDAADIGAGTSIWTRTLAARGLHSVVAVEPNDDMRGQGIETSRGANIVWHKGSAEATGLPDGSADLVSMASSFHWADFDKACTSFTASCGQAASLLPCGIRISSRRTRCSSKSGRRSRGSSPTSGACRPAALASPSG